MSQPLEIDVIRLTALRATNANSPFMCAWVSVVTGSGLVRRPVVVVIVVAVVSSWTAKDEDCVSTSLARGGRAAEVEAEEEEVTVGQC